jgi:hypothetical protein
VGASSRPEAVAEAEEIGFINRAQHLSDRALDNFVLQRGHTTSELHSYPTGLWDRLKSRIRFIHCAGGGSSF